MWLPATVLFRISQPRDEFPLFDSLSDFEVIECLASEMAEEGEKLQALIRLVTEDDHRAVVQVGCAFLEYRNGALQGRQNTTA